MVDDRKYDMEGLLDLLSKSPQKRSGLEMSDGIRSDLVKYCMSHTEGRKFRRLEQKL